MNFDVEEFEEKEFYAEVHFFNQGNLRESVFNFSEGNFNWKADCSLDSDKYEKIVKCSNKRFYAKMGGSNYLVDILTIVRKTEENVK